MELLLLSTSTLYGGGYLEYAHEVIRDFLGDCRTVHFAAYAMADLDEYTDTVRAALEPFGVTVVGVHASGDPRAAVEAAARPAGPPPMTTRS